MPQVGQLRWAPASLPSRCDVEGESSHAKADQLEELAKSIADFMDEAGVLSHLEQGDVLEAVQSAWSSGGYGLAPFQGAGQVLEQPAGAGADQNAELHEVCDEVADLLASMHSSGDTQLPQARVEHLTSRGLAAMETLRSWHDLHTTTSSEEESSDESGSDEVTKRRVEEEREMPEELVDPLQVHDAAAVECTSDAEPPCDSTAVLVEQLGRRSCGAAEAAAFVPLLRRSRYPELRPAYRVQSLNRDSDRCSPSSPSQPSTYPRSISLQGVQKPRHLRRNKSKMFENRLLESLYEEAGFVTPCPLQACQPRAVFSRRPICCSDAAAACCPSQAVASAAAASVAATGAAAAAAAAVDDATAAESARALPERLPAREMYGSIPEAEPSDIAIATSMEAAVAPEIQISTSWPWQHQQHQLPRPTAETHRWLPRHTAEALLHTGAVIDEALASGREHANTRSTASSIEANRINSESETLAFVPPGVEMSSDLITASSQWPHEPALATERTVFEELSEVGSAEDSSASIAFEHAVANNFTTEDYDDGLFIHTFPRTTTHVLDDSQFDNEDPFCGDGGEFWKNGNEDEEGEVRILNAKIDACKALQAPLRDRGDTILKCLHYARVAGSVAQKQAASLPQVLAALAEDSVQQAQAVAEMRTALEDSWKTEAEAVAESRCILERLKASRARCDFLSRQIKEAAAAVEKVEQDNHECGTLGKRLDSQGSLAEGHSSSCEAAADETFSQPEPEPFRSPPVRPQDAPGKDGKSWPSPHADQLPQAAWALPAAAVPVRIPPAPPPAPPSYPAPDQFPVQAPAEPPSPGRSYPQEAPPPAMSPLAWLEADIDEDEKDTKDTDLITIGSVGSDTCHSEDSMSRSCSQSMQSAPASVALPAADGGGRASVDFLNERSVSRSRSQSMQSVSASVALPAAEGGGRASLDFLKEDSGMQFPPASSAAQAADSGSRASLDFLKERSVSGSRSPSEQSALASAAAPAAGDGSANDVSIRSSIGSSSSRSSSSRSSVSGSCGGDFLPELELKSEPESAPSTSRSPQHLEQDKSDSAGNSECSEWSVPAFGPQDEAPTKHDANEEMHHSTDNSELSDWSVSPSHPEKAREVDTQAWNVLNEVHDSQGRTSRTAIRARALRSRDRAPRQPRVEETLTKKAVPRSSRRLRACSQRPTGEVRGASTADSVSTFLGARQRAASGSSQAWTLQPSPGAELGARSLRKLNVGSKVGGIVTRSTWLGALVDIGAEMDGLVGVEDMQRSGLRLRVGYFVKGLIIREVDLKSSRLLLSAKRAQIV